MNNSQASEKQVAFITKLMGEKDVASSNHTVFLSVIASDLSNDTLTKSSASKAIDILLSLSSKTQAKAKVNIEAGLYSYNDMVYKVQVSPNTGHSYAKVFKDNGWSYIGGAMKMLANATPLTLEEAKAYGKLYGVCIICSRTLTDEESIANGIGPICAGKF